MTTLDVDDGYAVLINTFEVAADRATELLDNLHEAAAAMRQMRGFVSANLHLNEDGTRVVNYAQWRSKADFEAMLRHPLVQPHLSSAAAIASSFEPVLYQLRYSDRASA